MTDVPAPSDLLKTLGLQDAAKRLSTSFWNWTPLPAHRTGLPRSVPIVLMDGHPSVAGIREIARDVRRAAASADGARMLGVSPSGLGEHPVILPVFVSSRAFPPHGTHTQDLAAESIVHLSAEECARATPETIGKLLLSAATSVLPLPVLAPYQTEGPVTGNRFFGREQLLRELIQLNQRNFILTGIRRIGKSSLLNAASTTIQDRAPHRVCFVSAERARSHVDVLRGIVEVLEPRAAKDLVDRAAKEFDQAEVARLLGRLTLRGQNRVVLIIDEADVVLPSEVELGYPLFHGVRVAAEAGQIHCVLAGGPALERAADDNRTPLFNFGQKKGVTRFTREEVGALVRDPMRDMGVQLRNPADVIGKVVDASGGHPQVVQYLLNAAVMLMDSRHTRDLTPGVIASVIEDIETIENYRRTAEAGADPLQLALLWTLAMASGDGGGLQPHTHSLPALRGMMASKYGLLVIPDQLMARVSALVEIGVLMNVGEGYAFASPMYGKALRERRKLQDELVALGRKGLE